VKQLFKSQYPLAQACLEVLVLKENKVYFCKYCATTQMLNCIMNESNLKQQPLRFISR